MQVIFEDENEKSNSGRANSMDVVICVERVNRYIEEEYIGRFRISRRIFIGTKERI